jgi:signal transduction histidine kinase
MVVILLVAAIIFFMFKYHNKILLQENTLQEEKYLHQQQLIQATLLAEEKEKQRLSKNVHDEMGTYASLLKMNASRLSLLPNQEVRIQLLIAEQKELISEITAFVRNISMELSSPTVKDFGIVAGIEELISVIKKNSEIEIAIHSSEPTKRFNHSTEIQVMRVIKELFNNMIKHAKPNTIALDYHFTEQDLSISITHDGAGISSEEYEILIQNNDGLGLKSMEARVQSIQGSIIYTKTNSNYQINLNIPLNYE